MTIADDHSSPSIHVRDDDRLLVLWSDRGSDDDEMRWVVSDDPLDASSFGDVQSFTADHGVDYPQPVEWDGDLRLYYRGPGDWVYRESIDNGDTWGSEDTLTTVSYGYTHPFKEERDGNNRLHFAMGDHRMSPSIIGHWYLEDGDYYETDGTQIQSDDNPISSSDDITTVYDGQNPVKQYDLIVEDGTPHVVFTEHVDTGDGGGDGDYRARWAKWNGSEWVSSKITEMGGSLPEQHYYEAGLSLDSQDPTTVYVSVETDERNYQVQEWTTDDGGDSWTKVQDLSEAGSTLTDPTKRGRPISPRNHDGEELNTIWWAGMYHDFDDYGTQIRDR